MNLHILRERLEGLMLFRVVMVTLFLGGALAVDVEALSDLSNPRNVTIVVLIVGTYALTIVYSILLRMKGELAPLAVMQTTLDLITVLVLVEVSRGFDSPFLFLFLIIVVAAAFVMGRRPAVYTATACTAALCLVAAERIGVFAAVPAPGYVWKDTVFRLTLNSSAGFVVAVLAGYLTERLGEATTRLEQQQVSIRELRALNENILASLSSGLLTVDGDQRVIFFNKAAEQITGLTSSDALGRVLSEVLPSVSRFVATGAGTSAEVRKESTFRRADGTEVFLGFSVSALLNADGEAVGRIVIFQDLSDIKRLEDQMRRSERLAAVGRLSAAIAHEIRNPLASISGSVEMLSTDESASEDDQTLMRIILREVDRLDELISEFLEYSRPRPLDLSDRDPVEVVESVLGLFKNRRAGVTVALETEPVSEVRLDSEAFQQVLWNLLNNASEACTEVTEPQISVSVTEEPDAVVVSVWDNGPGIPDDAIDRVFQPFFTTKANGTGLGLATIYRIVEDHGASISVDPHGPTGGARFRIAFPAQPD